MFLVMVQSYLFPMLLQKKNCPILFRFSKITQNETKWDRNGGISIYKSTYLCSINKQIYD